MARRVSAKALKIEDEELRDYELVLIFSPEIASESLDTAIGKVSQFITEGGGTLSTVEQWGKRKMAYAIKQFTEGSYVLTRFTLKPKLTRELKASLEISEYVLQHLMVKIG